MNNSNPILFISYSWDDQAHQDWVIKLASDLRHHGVDVILDVWDARLGDDLASFMERGLSETQLVLCICSDKYVAKANSSRGGVGYEKRIMSAELISDSNKGFIIPIIRNNLSKKVPTFLTGLKYADFSVDAEYMHNYSELLARIYNEDLNRKPPLGENPFITTPVSEEITRISHIQEVNFYNPATEGVVEFDYTRNSGQFSIGTGNHTFHILFSGCAFNSIYCYRDYIFRIGYNPKYTEFPTSEQLTDFDYSSRCKSLQIGEIAVLENKNHQFAAIKILDVKKNTTDIDHLVKFEYKIYLNNQHTD